MELGADRKSIAVLAGLLAVLAIVVYFQFLRTDPGTVPQAVREVPARAAGTSIGNGPAADQQQQPAQAGGRFRPRLGGSRREDRPDPMTADATLRTDLLDSLRNIEEPKIERDIFNFGRRRPTQPMGPTREEARQAQERLAATTRKPTATPPRPVRQPARRRVAPPNWKYYGLADEPGSAVQRAFLLDGEEILIASRGAVFQDRYRIDRIDQDSVVLKDLQADQEFSIQLTVPR